MNNNESLNVQDAARFLGVGKNKVYDMVKARELSSYRIGRKILFRLDDLQSFLDKKHITDHVREDSPEASLQDAIDAFKGQDMYTIAGQGLQADALVDQLEQMGAGAKRIRRTSYAGLVELYMGKVDAAVVHLYDQKTNSYNVPYVQRLAPGIPVVVLRLIGREVGFAVAKGNPKKISSWGALLREGVRIANRLQGSGARILLDEKLHAMDADPYVVKGYGTAFGTANAAIEAVEAGLADVALADSKLAGAFEGISFIPQQQEWMDLVIAKREDDRQLIRLVKRALADDQFKQTYAAITGGDMSHFGSIVYEC